MKASAGDKQNIPKCLASQQVGGSVPATPLPLRPPNPQNLCCACFTHRVLLPTHQPLGALATEWVAAATAVGTHGPHAISALAIVTNATFTTIATTLVALGVALGCDNGWWWWGGGGGGDHSIGVLAGPPVLQCTWQPCDVQSALLFPHAFMQCFHWII